MKKPKRCRNIFWGICIWLVAAACSPQAVSGGSLEMKIGQSLLQSFIDASFPITVTRHIELMGAVRVPLTVKLYNPGPVVLSKPAGPGLPFMTLSMEYTLSGDASKIPPVKGKLGGDFAVTASHDREYLILSFSTANVQVTPFLTISLTSLLKPIKIPIFRGFPVKVQGEEIIGYFENSQIGVEGTDLIIRGNFLFRKAQKTST